MPGDEDGDLSFLRALADDIIISVAERDPARVAKALVGVCERLVVERQFSWEDLQTVVAVLLLEWQERLSERQDICADLLLRQGDRALPENRRAREELKQQMTRAQDTARALHRTMIELCQMSDPIILPKGALANGPKRHKAKVRNKLSGPRLRRKLGD